MNPRCPTFIAGFWTVALLIAATLSVGAQPVVKLLKRAATPGDELVLGVDGDHLILLVHPDRATAQWLGSETRMAQLDGAPWAVTLPEVWGHVPQRTDAWSELGKIVHLDVDLDWGMAVLSVHSEGGGQVMFAGKTGHDNPTWGRPWDVPALSRFSGTCGFAVFDDQPGREGDLLVSLRPKMRGGAEALVPVSGQWKGGYDLARIRRKGGYTDVLLLDAINSPANEMALVSGPDGGGWLSTERLKGAGGLDPWWVSAIPEGGEAAISDLNNTLVGHTLQVRCGREALVEAVWQVTSGGMPVRQLRSNTEGKVDLGVLSADRRYGFEWVGETPDDCLEAVAEWRDAEGRLLRRVKLAGTAWSLSLLTTMPLGGWRALRGDRSRLPVVTSGTVTQNVTEPRNMERGPTSNVTTLASNEPADWVVFHGVGQLTLTPQDRDHIRSLAVQLRGRPNDVIRITGHASIDGDPQTNAALAAERARHVAAQLEFAGLQAAQIRFEGMGTRQPLVKCPPGVVCPSDALERSRRTELHIEHGKRADGRAMQ